MEGHWNPRGGVGWGGVGRCSKIKVLKGKYEAILLEVPVGWSGVGESNLKKLPLEG